MSINLWLDCDPGHDVESNLMMNARDYDAHAARTLHGNASLAQTTTNALRILTAINRTDIPVYAGAARPFCRSAVHAPDIHGESGLDGTKLLPEATSIANKGNAVLAMRDAIMSEDDGIIWVVATGALTNVALLFAGFPETVGKVKGLSVMGGCVGGGFTDAVIMAGQKDWCGNTTEWAEFNICCDPEAAQSIFSNVALAEKTTLIPLDLTHRVTAGREVQRMIWTGSNGGVELLDSAKEASNLRVMFHDLLMFFAGTYEEVFGLKEGPPLHDPVAIAVILPETAIHFDDRDGLRWHVEVVTNGLHSDDAEVVGQLGRTILTRTERRGVHVPRGLDVARFWHLINQALSTAEQTSS